MKMKKTELKKVDRKKSFIHSLIFILGGVILITNLENAKVYGLTYLFLFFLAITTTLIGISKIIYELYKLDKQYLKKNNEDDFDFFYIIKNILYTIIMIIISMAVEVPIIIIVFLIFLAYAVLIFEKKLHKKILK